MAPQPVVVTGVGVICAAGRDTTEFWTSLMGGRSGIDEATTGPFAEFDARFAGRVPDEWFMAAARAGAPGIDRTAALAVAAAREAYEGAGLDRARPEPDRIGLVLGKCQGTPTADGGYQQIHKTADVVAEQLGSRGPRVLLSTACAAGGNCIGLARDKLLTGEADVVLAGGVDPLQFGTYAGFAGLRALSTEPCRPYSASTGLNLGEGAAFLVVERLDHARERGATILAEVAGYGLSADAYHATAPDPTGRGGTSAVRRALADAGLGPDDVDYVCGHGTGTPANDAMERKVMRNVFGDRASSVPTSGIKSFLGHTLGAAGAIEGVASVLAIMHQTAPPTIGFDDDATDSSTADSSLDFVPNTARSMPIDTVVSTNYAFGGNNVAVVLRAPDENRPGAELPEREVVITGLGPVTGAGVGIGDFSAVVAGDTTGPDSGVTPQPDLAGRAFAPRTMWRQANSLSRLAIAASRLAWEDAALALRRNELENVGVMYATESGSRESVGDYDDSVLANPNSPAIHSFSNVVLNATGGAVCQALGFRGPTTTVCGGEASATLAMECGIETIRAGKAEVVFVVAADEVDDGTGITGASAIVLESADHARDRGATPYARIIASRHVGEGVGSTAAEEFGRTVAGADLTGLDAVYGDGAELVPGMESVTTAGVTGRCGSVTAALDVVIAAERISREGAGTTVVHAYAPGSVRGTVVLGRP
ncbi:beta-ketoacyl synthase N-terminal-like domain-containing protein [Dietzia cercidiphylli]|uniref:beta-ketoacyl synthase N-terminal-like domain-containing protein n=1 Tax=Dietzia cercidiphylli TaxID=498199 RepID=UPI00305EB004